MAEASGDKIGEVCELEEMLAAERGAEANPELGVVRPACKLSRCRRGDLVGVVVIDRRVGAPGAGAAPFLPRIGLVLKDMARSMERLWLLVLAVLEEESVRVDASVVVEDVAEVLYLGWTSVEKDMVLRRPVRGEECRVRERAVQILRKTFGEAPGSERGLEQRL